MQETPHFKLEISFGDSVSLEQFYDRANRISRLLAEFNQAKTMTGAWSVRLWFVNSDDPAESVLMHSWLRDDEKQVLAVDLGGPVIEMTEDCFGIDLVPRHDAAHHDSPGRA